MLDVLLKIVDYYFLIIFQYDMLKEEFGSFSAIHSEVILLYWFSSSETEQIFLSDCTRRPLFSGIFQ